MGGEVGAVSTEVAGVLAAANTGVVVGVVAGAAASTGAVVVVVAGAAVAGAAAAAVAITGEVAEEAGGAVVGASAHPKRMLASAMSPVSTSECLLVQICFKDEMHTISFFHFYNIM